MDCACLHVMLVELKLCIFIFFSVQKSISYRMTRSWHMLKDVRSYHGKYVNCGTNVGGIL
jgi:hypothetical protein